MINSKGDEYYRNSVQLSNTTKTRDVGNSFSKTCHSNNKGGSNTVIVRTTGLYRPLYFLGKVPVNGDGENE